MAITNPWQVANLTMYGTPPTCAVTFRIGDGVESVKLDLLASFYAQLVGLAVCQVLKTHQGTYQRSHHNVIFQL